MRVSRIAKYKYASDLSGIGAQNQGGRWNSPGRPVVYTGSCGALAALEYIAHIDDVDLLPPLKLLTIHIPDTLEHDQVVSTPSTVAQFRQYGDQWLELCKTPLLIVPSVLVPYQKNILINPVHPHAAGIKIESVVPWVIDERFLAAGYELDLLDPPTK